MSPRVAGAAGEAGACCCGSGTAGGVEGASRFGAEGLGDADPGPGYCGGWGEYPGGGFTLPLAALCAARLCCGIPYCATSPGRGFGVVNCNGLRAVPTFPGPLIIGGAFGPDIVHPF